MHPSLGLWLIKLLYMSEKSQKLRVLALVDNNNKSNWHIIMYLSRKRTNYCVCSLYTNSYVPARHGGSWLLLIFFPT